MTTPTIHASTGEHLPVNIESLTMVMTLDAVVLAHSDGTFSPDPARIAAQVASAVVHRAGYNNDVEPGEPVFVDVRDASWHPVEPAELTYTSERLADEPGMRWDWFGPEVAVRRNRLDQLREQYSAATDPAEVALVCHEIATELGWDRTDL